MHAHLGMRGGVFAATPAALFKRTTNHDQNPDRRAGWGVADYNDTHTHEEVLAMWDKAIELTKTEEV